MKECGLRIFGNIDSFTSNDIDPTNLVNSKPLYFYKNEVGLNFKDYDQFALFLDRLDREVVKALKERRKLNEARD